MKQPWNAALDRESLHEGTPAWRLKSRCLPSRCSTVGIEAWSSRLSTIMVGSKTARSHRRATENKLQRRTSTPAATKIPHCSSDLQSKLASISSFPPPPRRHGRRATPSLTPTELQPRLLGEVPPDPAPTLGSHLGSSRGGGSGDHPALRGGSRTGRPRGISPYAIEANQSTTWTKN
jgi:hypothetical protein